MKIGDVSYYRLIVMKYVDRRMPQTDKFEFADLNIVHDSNPATTLALVRRAVRLGYDTVAINIDVGDLNDVVADEVRPMFLLVFILVVLHFFL